MTKFVIGLLLGLILGVAGAAGFLITAQGGDYLIGTSPRVRELEADLRDGQREREWLRERLAEGNKLVESLESRFVGLAARFETLSAAPRSPAQPPPAQPPPAARPLPAPAALRPGPALGKPLPAPTPTQVEPAPAATAS